MFTYIIGWLLLSVVVGVAAETHRGRNGLISPFIAGLLVLALPKKVPGERVMKRSEMAARIAELDPSIEVNSRWDSSAMVAKIVELEATKKTHPGWKSLRA